MAFERWHPLDGNIIALEEKATHEEADDEEPECPECGGYMQEQDDGGFQCDDCGYEE